MGGRIGLVTGCSYGTALTCCGSSCLDIYQKNPNYLHVVSARYIVKIGKNAFCNFEPRYLLRLSFVTKATPIRKIDCRCCSIKDWRAVELKRLSFTYCVYFNVLQMYSN